MAAPEPTGTRKCPVHVPHACWALPEPDTSSADAMYGDLIGGLADYRPRERLDPGPAAAVSTRWMQEILSGHKPGREYTGWVTYLDLAGAREASRDEANYEAEADREAGA